MPMRYKDQLSFAMMGIVVACTLLVTGLTVRRELGGPAEPATPWPPDRPPVPVENWTQLSSGGRPLGDRGGRLTVVVFSDFECPFCRRFALETMPAIRKQFGTQVGFVFRHWPLRNHEYAYDAARAAECAAAQGRFLAFHDVLFAKQDSIGIKSFTAYAKDSSVTDLESFEKCIANTGLVPSIEADILEARRIGGRGTPTVIVDGVRLQSGADSASVAGVIITALQRIGAN